MTNQYSGKVAFISGANRGIGFETVKQLGRLGVTVILGARDLSKGQVASAELKAMGINAEAIECDANKTESADAVHT